MFEIEPFLWLFHPPKKVSQLLEEHDDFIEFTGC